MSHSPGIVYQTSRSIRSIHCRHFYFFNSKILVKPFARSKSFKFLLVRKSWFSFPTITESKSTFFILGPWKTRLLNTVEALTNSLVARRYVTIGDY
jgi:hypothetical protein